MTDADLENLTIASIAPRIKNREISPVQLVNRDSLLARQSRNQKRKR